MKLIFILHFSQLNKTIQKNFNESAVRSNEGGKEKHHKDKKERSAAKKLMKELSSCKTMLEEMEVSYDDE